MKAIASNGVEIQTGDAVLVRDGKNTTWSYCHFSHKKDDSYFPYCTSFTDSMYCIPYKGNEDLTGTTNDFVVPKKNFTYTEKQQKWIKKHNIKVGDKERIIRKTDLQENEWEIRWVSSMNNTIKKIGIITGINNRGIKISIENDISWWYPYHVLEKIEDKNEFRFGARVKAELDFITITGILIGYCKLDNTYRIATDIEHDNYIGNTYWCSKIEYLD